MQSLCTNNASPSLGEKRSFRETDDVVKVPSKSDFQFTPIIQPHQNIFNVNMHPSTWNASSLTHRYQQKLKAKKLNSELAVTSSTQQTTVDGSSHITTQSALPNSISTPWSNYLYHRSLSSTLIGYIQLVCSMVILSMVSYILFQLFWTLQQDFQIKADQYTTELIREIQSCAHQYHINMCQPETRVPALEKKCEHWLACSNRIPSHVTKAKVSAETLAEIFNSFFDALSYKTMFFFTFLTIGYLVASSFSFRFFKSRYQDRLNPS